MADIQLLSETLANQIAAGEVIENPASVVKELVENAIDAKSTRIDISIIDGGLKEITVIDDGVGIAADELPLAFERHATSKIYTKKDLFQVHTLGFRGEALAAIASIAKVTLTSARKNENQGATVTIAEGVQSEVKPATARTGTKVVVEDLFYATPNRYKYTKDLNKEAAKIVDLINRFALSYPHIRFQLKKDHKLLLQTNGSGNLHQVLARIYGVSQAKKMVAIKGNNFDFQVNGYISLPELTRASKNYMTIILNGRYIKNYTLQKAIETGYSSKLMIGRHPIAVVQIDFDPKLADVNVHPTKQEVRISKEEELVELIATSVSEALAQESLIPNAYEERLSKRQPNHNEQLAMDFSVQTKVQEPDALYEASQKIMQSATLSDEPIDEHWANDSAFDYPFVVCTQQKEDLEKLEQVGAEETIAPKTINYQVQQQRDSEGATFKDYVKLAQKEPPAIDKVFPHLEYFGQMHGTYLFAQNETGMYIIDQHAAQERIKYEEYRVMIGQVADAQQQMLLPLIFNFTLDDAMKIEAGLDDLYALGLQLESFGQNSYILHTHPTWMTDNIEQTIQDLIDLYLQDAKMTIATFREATAIMMSCKKSIKANHHLNDLQARQLIQDLAKCQNPFNCPHGRPVLVHITNYDMEKMFKRIQDPH